MEEIETEEALILRIKEIDESYTYVTEGERRNKVLERGRQKDRNRND